MRFLLLLALIGAVFWALRRSLGEQRQARLAQLGLPGRWRRDGGHELVLEGGTRAEVTESCAPMAPRQPANGA